MATLIAIILIVVLLLLLASGFAITFVYFPRWLIRRYTLTTERKIVAYFALAGLLVSVVFTCKYVMTRTEMITEAVFLWPTAMILMDLDGHASISAIIANFGLAIISNVGLYGWLGVLAGWIRKKISNNDLEV